jgi:hypothetical protein
VEVRGRVPREQPEPREVAREGDDDDLVDHRDRHRCVEPGDARVAREDRERAQEDG